jgi:hypothetical protein
MAANKAVNKVQNGTKTTLFRALHSTEKPSFINYLDETAKTAKPLCVGSIPTRASKSPQQLRATYRSCISAVAVNKQKAQISPLRGPPQEQKIRPPNCPLSVGRR